MVLEWKEREHEEVDAAVERDPGAQMALKRCGLYKFWALKGMRAQMRLLYSFLRITGIQRVRASTSMGNHRGLKLRIYIS
jgi:hypothetical protein